MRYTGFHLCSVPTYIRACPVLSLSLWFPGDTNTHMTNAYHLSSRTPAVRSLSLYDTIPLLHEHRQTPAHTSERHTATTI